MDRKEALTFIREKVPNENLIRHMIAVGAIMKKLAATFHEPPEKWELTGLVHDVDLGETSDPAQHGILGAAWLEALGFDPEICQAVRAHADHDVRETNLAKALYAADQLSGLIVACALVKGRKLSNVTPKTVRKRFKEKRFAAGADRASILTCKELGFELPEFIALSLTAMQEISSEIGL